VRRLGADGRRVAIGGISMGGFGAFDIARQAPVRFCAVGGHSAAVWTAAGDTAPGAFDDAEDFAGHDLVAAARARGRAPWGTARLWLDGGTADPFRPGDTALATALGIPLRHWPGGHDSAYWHAHYGRYLRFYASALAAC
jgi:enterochelin esterase-like enzyme